VNRLKKRISPNPVLVRFTDILRTRFDKLHNAFAQVIAETNYQGKLLSVYPIKSDQQSHVVSTILQHGDNRVELEAGSKPELMAVLGLSNTKRWTCLFNGYKDLRIYTN